MRRFTRVYPHKVVICLSRLHVLLIGIVLYSVLNRDVNRVWPTEFSIHLPTEKRSTKTEKVFNIGELLKRWKQEDREFINFNFTGKGSFDDLALGAIEYETRKLKLNDDTTHVIKVHFTPGNTYGQFVKLCDIMKLELAYRFAYSGDDFYVWQDIERW